MPAFAGTWPHVHFLPDLTCYLSVPCALPTNEYSYPPLHIVYTGAIMVAEEMSKAGLIWRYSD